MQQQWQSFFERRLEELHSLARFRGRSADSPTNNEALDFSSNDYLGLRRHPQVLKAAAEAIAEFGWGSGASPVLSGYTPAHAELEVTLSRFLRGEQSLLFSSGYAANVGTLSCLSSQEVIAFSDALNHASLIDGLRLGRGERHIYPHLDLQCLRELLVKHRHRAARCLIVTESVFSMDGDRADLPALFAIAGEFECGVVVDEAHATGIYGAHGGGCLEECALSHFQGSPLLCKLGTLSKALGGIGGFATSSSDTMHYLVNHGRSYLFSTSPPAAVAAAAVAALRLLPGLSEQRSRLREHSTFLRAVLGEAGWKVPAGDSPIVPVIVGSETNALGMSRHLRARGILVPAIRPPTVPVQTCRLRISLSAIHRRRQLLQLVEAMNEYQIIS
jgi:8-amino-7-oxononanoate synthase